MRKQRQSDEGNEGKENKVALPGKKKKKRGRTNSSPVISNKMLDNCYLTRTQPAIAETHERLQEESWNHVE